MQVPSLFLLSRYLKIYDTLGLTFFRISNCMQREKSLSLTFLLKISRKVEDLRPTKDGSPSLVVMGDDSCSRDCGFESRQKVVPVGTGGGSVGRAVTSNTRDLWFQSCLKQNFIQNIHSLWTIRKSKEKYAGNGPTAKYLKSAPNIASIFGQSQKCSRIVNYNSDNEKALVISYLVL